jgi:SAM-dependent methyltransferase
MAETAGERLKEVYAAKSNEQLAAHYDSWAADYDADVGGFGYTYPALIAGLVGRHVKDLDAPLLDAGCGTGMIGVVLAALGHRDLIGVDLSEGMLGRARDKGVYEALERKVLGEPLGFPDGRFAAAVCAGVLTVGHAPPESLDELARVVRPGGHVIFTLSRPVLEERGFKEKIEALGSAGRWRLANLSREIIALPGAPQEAMLLARGYVFEVT